MQRRYIILIGLIGVMVVFVFHGNQTPNVIGESHTVSEFDPNNKFKNNIQAEEAAPTKSFNTNRNISAQDLHRLNKSLPAENDVKAEAGQLPHQTPRSLINFAENLGRLMEKARKNPRDANVLMIGLNACVSDSTVAVSARALCLSKSEQLVEVFPKLQEKLTEIRENADKDVHQLESRKKSFIRSQKD